MKQSVLIIGDLLAIGLVTYIGFATHGEADVAFLPRMAAAFLPLTISWFLFASFVGLLQGQTVPHARQLGRVALTAFFAAPLAAVLRGFILNAPVIPIFAVVLALVSALGMVLWRALHILLIRRI